MLPKQARIIDALARMEPTTQVALAREFNVAPSSMSTMTSRLIERGYITREVDPSEIRSNIVRLTALGRSLLSDIHDAWRDIDALIATQIGGEGSADLEALTRELRNGLGGRTPGQRSPAEASAEMETNK